MRWDDSSESAAVTVASAAASAAMARHIWGKEGTMGNSDHGATCTYTASRD